MVGLTHAVQQDPARVSPTKKKKPGLHWLFGWTCHPAKQLARSYLSGLPPGKVSASGNAGCIERCLSGVNGGSRGNPGSTQSER